ncbi:hypothetical protein F5Y17DRAFT_422180 [Xylariaceae sp. FL0594]|nr:hypothetical protein F5Y17DRAFT_422180 [Xylariaceae sp. FL0594]
MDSEEIETFKTVTGVNSDNVARGYLQIAGGSAMEAIQMFFDSPELQSSFEVPPSAAPAAAPRQSTLPRRRTGREDSSGVIHIDSDDDDDVPMTEDGDDDTIARDVARSAQEEEDAAMARRLQEELYGSTSGGGADEGVRAPIAQTTETLAAPDYSWNDDLAREHLLQARPQRRQQAQRNPFDQRPSIWDDGRAPVNPDPGADPRSSSRSARLRDLFRPPHEIMSDATWDEAREEGKAEKKWIMVNLQDLDIFHCQVLNRDVWKDENLQLLIKEHFIFLQYDKNEARAQPYIQFYFTNGAHENGDNYPHLAIIDPRTGEQVKSWSGLPFPKAGELYGELIEFLDRYSLAANSKNPVVQSKPKRQPLDIGRLTEDEMLQLAMQNSLESQGGPSGTSVLDPDKLTKPSSDVDKGKSVATDEPAGAATSDSVFSLISSTAPHSEPAHDPATTTRIQFRHSGGRVIRRFAVSDPVRRIYEWLKSEPLEGQEGVNFELKLMPQGMDLISELDKTINDTAGLKQGTVMIEFVED